MRDSTVSDIRAAAGDAIADRQCDHVVALDVHHEGRQPCHQGCPLPGVADESKAQREDAGAGQRFGNKTP